MYIHNKKIPSLFALADDDVESNADEDPNENQDKSDVPLFGESTQSINLSDLDMS